MPLEISEDRAPCGPECMLQTESTCWDPSHIADAGKKVEPKPHKCPVCEGCGKKYVEGLRGDNSFDCHGCHGKGIVWG